MTSHGSSHMLRMMSLQPVTVFTSFCSQTGCDYIFPITPQFPNQTAVSLMEITSSVHQTSVDILPIGERFFKVPLGNASKLLRIKECG